MKPKKSKALNKRAVKRNKQHLAGSHVRFNFKKHLLPPLAGLLVAVLVFGFFNSGLLSAKIAYYLQSRHPSAQTNIVPASTVIDKNAPPTIVIKKINVNAPVIYSQATVDQGKFMQALQSGVVHYPNTAFPGQQGNAVIFGHSSEAWWAPGNYKYVFTLLDKLQIQDLIFLNYQGTRYVYRVYDTTVVAPNDLSVLNQGGNHILTLLTCTPVGTSQKRLVVRAQQILPKVGNNVSSTQPAKLPQSASGALPSNASSFWSNLKSLF